MTKCDMCGKMFKTGYRGFAVDLCSPACANAFHLKVYLDRLEECREKAEADNPIVYQEARELAGWLAIYRFGSEGNKKQAAKVIKAFVR